MKLTLRPYQIECIEKFKERIDHVDRGGLIVLPTGCLAGDSIIQINRAGNGRRVRIDHLAFKARGGVCRKVRKWNLDIPTMVARAEGDVIKSGVMKDAWCSGTKLTFKLTTDSGRTIRATAEHPFLTDCGWAKLSDLRVGSLVQVVGSQKCKQGEKKSRHYRMKGGMNNHPFVNIINCKRVGRPNEIAARVAVHRLVAEANLNSMSYEQFISEIKIGNIKDLKFIDPVEFHVHHKDENKLNNSLDNLEVITAREHHLMHSSKDVENVLYKVDYEKVVSIEMFGEEVTYDISMADDPHNFVANGFVVHNTGKSLVMGEIARWWLENRKGGVGIASHRIELVKQNAAEFDNHMGKRGMCHIELGSEFRMSERDWDNVRRGGVVSFTVQTLQNSRIRKAGADTIGLVLFDETHRAKLKGQYATIREYFGCKVVGLTATPDRTDGQGLVPGMFDEVWYGNKEGQLLNDFVEQGWLTPPRIQHVHVKSLQLQWLKGRSGKDFTNEQVAKVWQDYEAIHEFVAPILKEVGDKKTLYFCPGVQQAKAVTDVINSVADPRRIAEYVASYKIDEDNNEVAFDKHLRRSIIKRFGRTDDELQHVANMGVFVEGTNIPIISAIGWLRFTKSRLLLAQGAGRAFRTWPGILNGMENATAAERRAAIAASPKPYAIIFDPTRRSGTKLRLAHLIDIFNDTKDDEVQKHVEKIIKRKVSRDEPYDPREVLAEAKALETPFFKGLRAALLEIAPIVDYRLVEVDPYKGDSLSDWSRKKPEKKQKTIGDATPAQKRKIAYLTDTKYSDDFYLGLTKKQAGAMIGKKLGEPTVKWMAAKIRGRGLAVPKTNGEALNLIKSFPGGK